MNAMLELEQQDIELQLKEISLKRRKIEIEREQLNNMNRPVTACNDAPARPVKPVRRGYLHYSDYVKENYMKIQDICPDGSIMIRHGKDTVTVSKKYSMKSLSWIRQRLPSWVKSQREEKYFLRKLAARYSRKFLKSDETISHTTMEKLCYIVDSGEVDIWFDKYDSLKGRGMQSTLDA